MMLHLSRLFYVLMYHVYKGLKADDDFRLSFYAERKYTGQNVRPDLSPNCLKWILADNNVT